MRDDEEQLGFFPSLLGEHDDDTHSPVTWASRSEALRAKPFDSATGLRMFDELWGKDSHTVALEARDLDRLSQEADRAMHLAKHGGRNRVASVENKPIHLSGRFSQA